MNSSDFEYDHHRFQRAIVMSAGGYKRAKECLVQNFANWQEIGAETLRGNFSINVGESGDLITGEILGRKFNVHLSPFIEDEKGYAEMMVSTPNLLGGDLIECCRFLVAANGSVLSSDKEELLAWDDGYQSYRLLVAVARRVLSTPAQV